MKSPYPPHPPAQPGDPRVLAAQPSPARAKHAVAELSLNEIFLGFRSYGIVTAAQNYFNKSIDEQKAIEMQTLEERVEELERLLKDNNDNHLNK